MLQTFELIYKNYYKRVYAFLYKLCKNADLAEDLTQETFYQAYISLHRFMGKSDIFTYLASIGKHTYYKYLRKNKMSVNSISLSEITDVFSDIQEYEPQYIFEKEAISDAIKKILDNTTDKYRDIIIYRIYANMSFAQIAAAMDITENTAKVTFFRAKKMVLEELKNGNYM